MKNNSALTKDFINHKYYQNMKFRLVYFHLMICKGEEITFKEIAENTNLKVYEVRKIILSMIADGNIVKHSINRSRTYYTINKLETNKSEKKGTRIDESLSLTSEWKVEAVNIGVSNPDLVFSEFKDYWIAKSGKGAVKLDWLATWRNWCRKSIQFNKFVRVEDDIPEEFIGLKPSEVLKKRGLWQ